LSLINATVGQVFPCQFLDVVVKTLTEKTAHYPNQKAPLPNLGNLPAGWELMPLMIYARMVSAPKIKNSPPDVFTSPSTLSQLYIISKILFFSVPSTAAGSSE